MLVKMSITKKHQNVLLFYHGFWSFTIVNVSMCQSYKKVLLWYRGAVMVILWYFNIYYIYDTLVQWYVTKSIKKYHGFYNGMKLSSFRKLFWLYHGTVMVNWQHYYSSTMLLIQNTIFFKCEHKNLLRVPCF